MKIIMKHLKNNRFIYLVLVILIGIVSCKQTETFNTKDLYVYVPTGTVDYNVTNGGSIVNMRNTIISNSIKGFPVVLTRSTDRDVKVSVSIDTGLVKVYDKIFKLTTPSPKLPDGAFQLISNTVTINSGQIASTDSLTIKLGDGSKLKPGTNTYIIPIVIKSVDNNIPISNNRQVMYVKLSVTSIASSITSLSGGSIVDVLLNNINSVNIGVDVVNLQASLNRAIPTPATVSIEDVSSLVSSYNTLNKTSYQPFPNASFQLEKAVVNIVENSTVSADKFLIKLTDLSKFAIGTTYLLGLKIKPDDSANSLPVDESKNIVYIRLKVEKTNIAAITTPASGSDIPRTAWTIAGFSTQELTGDVSPAINVLDNSATTIWHSIWYTPQPDGKIPSLPQWISINMGKQNTIKCITYLNRISSTTGQPSSIEVLTSTDGIAWVEQGTYSPTQQLSGYSTPKVISFIMPVTAQYFKFNINNTFGATPYTFLAEIKANQ